MDPKYLLLDEPLAGLDAEGCGILMDCLHRRCDAGTAVLMASHDPDVICENSDRVIRMDQGKIIFDGTAEAAFSGICPSGTDPDDLGHVRQTVVQLRAAGIALPDGILRFRDLASALRDVLRERRENV